MTIETHLFSFGTEISGCEMVDRTRGFVIMGYKMSTLYSLAI